jgi:hypothetical protein
MPWESGVPERPKSRRDSHVSSLTLSLSPDGSKYPSCRQGRSETTEIVGLMSPGATRASYGRGISLVAGATQRSRLATLFLSANGVPTHHAKRAVCGAAAFNASPPHKEVTEGRCPTSVLAAVQIHRARAVAETACAGGARAGAVGLRQTLNALAIVHVAVREHAVVAGRALRVRRAPGPARVIDARGPARRAVRIDVALHALVVRQIADFTHLAVVVREALNALLRR